MICERLACNCFPIKEGRIGRVNVRRGYLRLLKWTDLKGLFDTFGAILRVDFNENNEVYVICNPSLRPIERGEMIPEYELIVNNKYSDLPNIINKSFELKEIVK